MDPSQAMNEGFVMVLVPACFRNEYWVALRKF